MLRFLCLGGKPIRLSASYKELPKYPSLGTSGHSLKKHGAYELILVSDVPQERKVSGIRFVYQVKTDGVN